MAESIGLRIIKEGAAAALAGAALGPHPKPVGLQVDRRTTHVKSSDQLEGAPRVVVFRGRETVKQLACGDQVTRSLEIILLHQVRGSNAADAPPPDDVLDPLFVWGTQQMMGSMDEGGGTYFGGLADDVVEVETDMEYVQDRVPLAGVAQTFVVQFDTKATDPTAQPG